MTLDEALDRVRKAKSRKDAVAVYLDGLREWPYDAYCWPVINAAIIGRWSLSALIWIKRSAWKEKLG